MLENLMSFLVSLRKSSFRILFLKCGKSGHNHHTLQKFCFLLLKNLLPSFFLFTPMGTVRLYENEIQKVSNPHQGLKPRLFLMIFSFSMTLMSSWFSAKKVKKLLLFSFLLKLLDIWAMSIHEHGIFGSGVLKKTKVNLGQ